jgi:hypothetical protein
MQAKRDFEWGQNKVDEVIGMTKEQRHAKECQRRLQQMEKNRQKKLKKKSDTLVTVNTGA